MLNYIWGFMLLIGIVYSAFTGNLSEVTNAALSSSKEAVTLCITMLGVISFWTGMMSIAQNAGILTAAEQKLQPLLKFLFPDLPVSHKAHTYISTNFIANIFGLGWAATPAGLKAMKALAELEEERGNTKSVGIASDEMCTFLILNISSLQLIPVNIIAYRSQYGSANPAAIVGPGLLATLISTITAIIFCKIMHIRRKKI